MDLTTNCDSLKVAERFKFITLSHCSFVILIVNESWFIPALFTKISIDLNLSIDLLYKLLISSSLDKSAIILSDFVFKSLVKLSTFFLFVPVAIIFAPKDESYLAIDPPIAPEAPVIKAVLFFYIRFI